MENKRVIRSRALWAKVYGEKKGDLDIIRAANTVIESLSALPIDALLALPEYQIVNSVRMSLLVGEVYCL
jgi:hypothetical protein